MESNGHIIDPVVPMSDVSSEVNQTVSAPFFPPISSFPAQNVQPSPTPELKSSQDSSLAQDSLGPPPAKRPKIEETSTSLSHSLSATSNHVSEPIHESTAIQDSPSVPSSGLPKAKDEPKKKTGRQRKAISNGSDGSSSSINTSKDSSNSGGQTTKKSESSHSADVDSTPLRARNNASLEALGLSWQEPKYQPHPNLHPMKTQLSLANSSKGVIIQGPLTVNSRGYNLVRANYPAQTGSWYFEITVLDAFKIISNIQQQQKINSEMAEAEALNAQLPNSDSSVNGTNDTSNSDKQITANKDNAMEIDDTSETKPSDSNPATENSVAQSSTTSQTARSPATKDAQNPANLDYLQFSNLLTPLMNMNHLNDATRRPLPPPHWRLGWATEMADVECPVGTDINGFSWRNDGSLFHQARQIKSFLHHLEKQKASQPNNQQNLRLERLSNDEALFNCDSFAVGDILGFGIELPEQNMDLIREQHEHQESVLKQQDEMFNLRWTVINNKALLQSPQVIQSMIPKIQEELEEAKRKITASKPIPPLQQIQSLSGSKLTFWKNGTIQKVMICDIPPGSWYPAVSLYYQAGAAVNFGPTFSHPPPAHFRPCSELPDAYKIPLPGCTHLPKPIV